MHYRRASDRRQPLVGLLIMAVTACVFWGSCFYATVTTLHWAQDGKAFRRVCERLIAGGWDEYDVDGCVRLFRESAE